MKVKLLKKIRKQYPIYFVEQVDEDSHPVIYSYFKLFGCFYFTGEDAMTMFADIDKNVVIDRVLRYVRRDWSTKIKGRTQKMTRL